MYCLTDSLFYMPVDSFFIFLTIFCIRYCMTFPAIVSSHQMMKSDQTRLYKLRLPSKAHNSSTIRPFVELLKKNDWFFLGSSTRKGNTSWYTPPLLSEHSNIWTEWFQKRVLINDHVLSFCALG